MDVKEKLLLLKQGFSKEQADEIEKGADGFLDTSLYAKKEFNVLQMKEIRLGMEEGLDAEIYARPDFDWLQMEEIRLGLKNGDDVRKFAFPRVKHDTMHELRLGLKEGCNLAAYSGYPSEVLKEIRLAHRSGVNIITYVEQKYDAEQLHEIRLAFEDHVGFEEYIKPDYRGISLREIRIGLERQVAVSEYADLKYEWRQMRELRLGLEHQINIDHYRNPLYDWRQMRELRKGLELGLNVDYYSSFMYTSNEMRKRREYMLENMSDEFKGDEAPVIINYDDFVISIEPDELSATVMMIERPEELTKEAVIRMLRDKNIVYGIKDSVVSEIVDGLHFNEPVVIAEGKRPVSGEDGYYEFFIKTELNREPKVLDDGSLDYQDIEWFEQVTKDQKLAYYHDATDGEEGCTITGRFLPSQKGRQLSVINGEGFRIDGDRKTYLSNMDGIVEYKNDRLVVSNVLRLKEVTAPMGNVIFNGSIDVQGNVQTGAYISADGDVYVSGVVEGAVIEAKGNIVIKQGINASKRGSVKADGNISARFIETANIRAGGDIEANYILNSTVNCKGKIKISGRKGSIIGGTTYATREISVHDIGNDVFTKTLVKVGLDDEMVKEHVRCTRLIKDMEKEIEVLDKLYKQMGELFTDEQKKSDDMFVKIEATIFSKNKEKKKIENAREAIAAIIKKTNSAQVIVAGTAYENSVVDINGKRWFADGSKDLTIKAEGDNSFTIENKG
ncbi:MAG: FapA family protein [Lachnospiraceae bacterium]|nr:FapA family protein [Lachnospiraceae bacterium]